MDEPPPPGAFQFKNSNIICFSTADWDTPLPTNKHQLMRRLAAKGSRVLFVETLGTRAPSLTSGTDLTRIGRRLWRGFEGATKREPRLWTVSPVVRPAWKSGGQIAVNQVAFRAQVGPILGKFPNPIAWIYSPYAVYLLDQLNPRGIVYHMVDDLAAVPGADPEALREAENLLLARADIVFCTERSLHDRARRINPRSHFLPNVADYKLFSTVEELPANPVWQQMRSLAGPKIVFSGNLAPHKVDFNRLDWIAAKRPDWNLVLIGPPWEGANPPASLVRLRRRPNVLFTGLVPQEQLPAYLHLASVLLIPYVLNDATRAVFPLKLFEYLGTGKPVVSSPLPSLLPYQGAIRIARVQADWLAEIDGAMESNHELEAQRRALARRHTWEKRLEEMEDLLNGAIKPLVADGLDSKVGKT